MEDEPRADDLATARPSRQSSYVRRHRMSIAGRDGGSRPGRSRFGLLLSGTGLLGLWGESGEEAAENEVSIDELQSKIHELQNQARNALSEANAARNEANTARNEASAACDEASAARNEAKRARNEANVAWSRVRAEQEENRRLLQTVKELESERDSMSRSAKKQEEQIRQVQALAFEGIGGDSWAGGDDSTARADLENLHSRLKSWAKKYAIEEMSEVRSLAPDEYGSFIQLLTQVVPLHGPGTPNDSGIEHLESGFMNRKSPVVCIQGLLSHHVYAKVISKPFFALGDAGEALQNVHRAIRKVNETESHIWRSRTLRLLATSSTNVQQQGSDGRHNYIASQKAVCHHFASEFYNGPAKHLIKSPTREGGNADTQCFNDLESIVQYAGELSYRLWTRRTLMSFMSLPDLYNQPFRMGSDIMKAHPLHKLYEDDGRCDGWFVGVVAHPAVLAFGSSDGKDYNSGRVWMQAEVWLTEDDGVKK